MGLPVAVSRDHEFLQAMCALLAEQNALLADIRDRLTASEPPAPAEPDPVVEQVEPAPVEIELQEPATPARTPAKKTTAARSRTTKKGT